MSTAVPGRPLPQPSELTQEFWDAARERRLVRPVCDACGRSFFTPQIACPHCLSPEWTYVTSSGRGTVHSTTVVHRAPFPGFQAPYHVGVVDLEEGWHLLTNVVDVGPEPVPIGTPVVVTWIDAGDGFVLPAFRPQPEASA